MRRRPRPSRYTSHEPSVMGSSLGLANQWERGGCDVVVKTLILTEAKQACAVSLMFTCSLYRTCYVDRKTSQSLLA